MIEELQFDAFLCFDANLSKLERCETNCEINEHILCIHRFRPKTYIFNITSNKFEGWSDLQVVTYFLGEILIGIAEKKFDPNKCIFILLTKDRNFIEDVRFEASAIPNFEFSYNFIYCGGITIIVKQINCPNYGHNRTNDMKCAIEIVNEHFYTVNGQVSSESLSD